MLKFILSQLCIVVTILSVGIYANMVLYSWGLNPYICISPLCIMLLGFIIERAISLLTGSIDKELRFWGCN